MKCRKPTCGSGARRLFVSACAVVLAASPAAWATNHIVQFDEVMAGANGDSLVQFVEIKHVAGQNTWGPVGGVSRAKLVFFDATGANVGEFLFPNDPPQIPGTQDPNTPNLFSALMATNEFVAATGLVPDFIIPSNVINRAGKVCFKDHSGPFVIDMCVSYGDNANPDVNNGLIPYVGPQGFEGTPAAALPITNAQSLQRFQNFGCLGDFCQSNADFQLSAPAPRNGNGGTVTINVASTFDQGEKIFRDEPFLGNGRSCFTCHRDSDGFGLNPSTIANLPATDLLFVAEFDPNLSQLENPCLMRGGRSLILENVHGFSANPVFRTSPHLMNIAATAPYGWSPAFGGASNLRDFCAGAVKQHFPKFLPRNFDPNNGPLSQRTATVEELTFMEEFQNSIKTKVNDGQGDLGGNLTQNLDRLIAAFVACNATPTQSDIDTGRALFASKGCQGCHAGPFLGATFSLATGVVNDPANNNDGCQGGPGDPTLPLPNEDVECGNDPNCNPPLGEMQFDIRPLVDIARVRENFFHAGERGDLRSSVEFYTTSAFANSVGGFPISMTSTEIDQVTAFLTAIVEVPACDGACCLPDGTCIQTTQGDCDAQCGSFSGTGTNCTGQLCPIAIPGACCLPDGNCIQTNGACECDLAGGMFRGPGSYCLTADCPQPGACCLPDGTCQVMQEEDCADQCGNFEGSGIDCSSLDMCCIDLPRSCCLPDGTCTDVTKCACEQLGGVPGDIGSSCETAACPVPGACCLPNGSCTIMFQPDCAAQCGFFQGPGSACSPFCLLPAPRPCCLPDGTCASLQNCVCLQQGGTPQNGFSCQSLPALCPQPTGACCLPNGTCKDNGTKADCLAECGNYRGDGTTCAGQLCPIQLSQACCLPNGTCRNLTPCQCSAAGGNSQGLGSSCGIGTLCPLTPLPDVEFQP